MDDPRTRHWIPVAVAAVLALGMLWLSGAPFDPSGRPRVAGRRAGDPVLLRPSGSVPEFPRRFEWEGVPGADLYEISVMETGSANRPLFRQRGVSTVLKLTFEEGAEPGPGDYVWEVRAFREARLLGSTTDSFRVVPGP